MKLWYCRKAKDPTYFIQKAIRDGKKVTSKNIVRIGKHSELLAKGIEDPLAYAKEVVEKYNIEHKTRSVSIELNIRFDEDVEATNNIESSCDGLNVGYFYLQNIYSKLKIKQFFDKIADDRKYKFNADDINRFLTFDRIFEPQSKYAFVADLKKYYEKPEFSHQQVLRFMDVLADNYDDYLAHLYKNSENVIKRDTSICYYDCTNYYFEIEQEDEYIDPITGEILTGLRQYGYSKEHRPNPIVQMGLFMDKNGIPLSMGIFAGNRNEQSTACDHERSLIKMLKDKQIIYCADAGLGSADIRSFNTMGGKAFIVTQSIKKLSQEIKDIVFEDSGYKLLSSDINTSLKELQTMNLENEDNLSCYKDYAYKVIDIDSNVDLGLFEEKVLKNGNTIMVKSKAKLPQRLIITYSRKYAEFQKYKRDKQIERAKNIIATKNPEDIKKGNNDVRRFIKLADKTKKSDYILDEERIKEEAKYDGFYAIATSLTQEKSIKEIIEISHNRYKIEDCFRVLKSNFNARPVYHRLDNRIKVHFLICYTALLIYRLLEAKLINNGYNFSINNIINTLKNMYIVDVEHLYFQARYNGSQVLTALIKTFDIDLGKKRYERATIRKNLKK